MMLDEEDYALAVVSSSEDEGKEEETIKENWGHEQLAQVRIKVLLGHQDSVNSCQFFDNDRKTISASSDKTIKIWDNEKGQVLRTYSGEHTDNINCAFVNENGRRFVSCGWDKKVAVHDIESGNILWTGQHAGIVTSCQFSHDGHLVISGSDLDNTLKIWDANTGDLLHDVNDIHKSTISKCIFSPQDDKVITTSMDKTSKFYDLRSHKVTITIEGHINVISSCDITFDERKYATASWDKTIKLWDVATGSYRSKGPCELSGSHDGSISSCCFSEDGLMMVSGSFDNTLVVWDVENQVQKLRLQGHDDWVQDVSFSASQQHVMSASKDGTLRIWSVDDADKIPVVMERKKAIGLKIIKCSSCGKPFSMSQLENLRDVSVCVFCRLKNREKTMLEIMSMVDEAS